MFTVSQTDTNRSKDFLFDIYIFDTIYIFYLYELQKAGEKKTLLLTPVNMG